MIRCILIDDEQLAREVLREELGIHCPDVEVVAVADSVRSAIAAIALERPDLVLLDVQLGDGTGFDVLEKLTQPDFRVIFTTAYSEYAVKAFQVAAVDYLLKPIKGSELRAAVQKATTAIRLESQEERINTLTQLMHRVEKRIPFATSDGISIHHVADIIRCEADNNYCRVHLRNKESLMLAKTLKDLEALLAEHGFERVHQSHLVNMAHVNKYVNRNGGHLVLSDGIHVPVSQRRKTDILDLLSKL